MVKNVRMFPFLDRPFSLWIPVGTTVVDTSRANTITVKQGEC